LQGNVADSGAFLMPNVELGTPPRIPPPGNGPAKAQVSCSQVPAPTASWQASPEQPAERGFRGRNTCAEMTA